MPEIKNFDEAKKSLVDNGYMTQKDEYLNLCAMVLAFLSNTNQFEAALKSVSAFIWSYYTGLDPNIKNKFSISLGMVAQMHKFRVSTRPIVAPHPDALPLAPTPLGGPMDIKLVGSYGDFYGLLRERMFWKDSMDMEHGEYSHALQWLAIASEFGPRAAALYAELPKYSHKKNKTEVIPLWSYLADCFPDTKKADAELISNTYRSPQMITKHLIGSAQPIKDHFVSFYLTYVYKQRKLVSYDLTKVGSTKANYGSASTYALDKSRADAWNPVTEKSPKTGLNAVTRLDRKPTDVKPNASKTVALETSFHGIPGKFWTRGDWDNLTFD